MAVNIYDTKVDGEKLDYNWYNDVQLALGGINTVGSYPVQSASYILFKVGAVYYARNGRTGAITFSDPDATIVIQAAIDAVETIGLGGRILLMEAEYPVTGDPALSITGDNIYLEGLGWGTQIHQTAVGDTLHIGDGSAVMEDGGGVKNLFMRGAFGVDDIGILARDADHLVIDNVKFIDFAADGSTAIKIMTVSGGISMCKILYPRISASNGILLDGTAFYLTGTEIVGGAIFKQAANFANQSAIKLITANNTRIMDAPHMDSFEYGIHVITSSRCLLSGYFENMRTADIYTESGLHNNINSKDIMALPVGVIDTATRTRFKELFVPIHDIGDANIAEGSIGDHYAIQLDNNLDVTFRFNFKVPQDLILMMNGYIYIVSTAANPTIRWSMETDLAGCGQIYSFHHGSIAIHDDNFTQNNIECLDISAALPIAIDDINKHIGVEFFREGSHVNDDAAVVRVLGFVLQYL